MGKTLKVYSYRGINIYIRSLGGLWYEALIAFKGGIYAHQLQLLKPIKNERRNNTEEREKGAISELMMIASSLVDDLKEKGRLINKIKIYITKTYGKISTEIRGSKGEGPRLQKVQQEQG